MLDLYLDSGYLNVSAILDNPYKCNFIIVVAGRGVGKTYGGLLEAFKHYKKRFMYLRRTEVIVDLVANDKYSPYKKLNMDLNLGVTIKKINKKLHGFYEKDNREPFGLFTALTAISDVRGADLNDIDLIFYDEFIPEEHKKLIKGEGKAVLNTFETINRNRELDGKPPAKMFLASNSDNIFHPVLASLGVTDLLLKMQNTNKSVYYNRQRRLLLINCQNNPISALKNDTALYQFNVDKDFKAMAIDNHFADVPDIIKSMPIGKQDKLLYCIGRFNVYHLALSDLLYVTTFKINNPIETFSDNDREVISFKRSHVGFISQFFNNSVLFENVSTYSQFTELLKLPH